MNTASAAPPGGSVKSAARVLTILELLTTSEAPMTFAEIAAALGYPRSSLHGLLRTLQDAGWISLDARIKRYSLGIRAWEAGNAYSTAVDLAERARPFMERVRDALDETVQLAVLDDGRHNVYVAKVDGTQLLVLESRVGRRLAAHATGVGKVLLAALPSHELQQRLGHEPLERFTERTVTDRAALLGELERTRRNGYALDNEEYTKGVRCVAVPVRDHTGQVVAGMSVSVPVVRFNGDRRAKTRAALLEAAAGLSAALGHRPSGADRPNPRRGSPA
jgi:DNA-binding IclR family transcriptional regulator